MKTEYEIHPAAMLFPMMDDAAFQSLKADIKENGQDQRITFYKGMILDGRNRLKACQELGIEPRTEEIDDDADGKFDPYKWVLSINLHRRHLTESQRAMVAAKLAKLKRGDVKTQRESSDGQICPPSIEQAASMLNVSSGSVKSAKQVLEHGSKEIIEAVEQGQLPVSFTAKVVAEEPDKKTQTKLLKSGGKQALKKHITEPSPFVEDCDKRKGTSMVTINSGPVEATDKFENVPKEKWMLLMIAKHSFLSTNLPYDCQCLINFCEEAEDVYKELGYKSAKQMIKEEYGISEREIDIAHELLHLRGTAAKVREKKTRRDAAIS